MYIPPMFRTDDAAAWSFVAARGFGTVVAIEEGRPVAAHVPLLATAGAGARKLSFHLARANPLGRLLAASPQVLVVVSGPDGYVSPDWYESPNQVPTWNYVSVHLTGSARILPPEASLGHVDALSAEFESRLAPKRPWTTAKMTPVQRDRMLAAITPVEVTVEAIEAQWKLNQNKTAADRANVVRMLDWRGDWSSLALAEMMRSWAGRASEKALADQTSVVFSTIGR